MAQDKSEQENSRSGAPGNYSGAESTPISRAGVRTESPSETVPKSEHDALRAEMEQLRWEHAEELRRREFTHEVAAAILTGRPLPEIGVMITDVIAERLRVERVALFLRDENNETIPLSLRNVSAEYGGTVTQWACPGVMASRASATGMPYHARDIQNDTEVAVELRDMYRRENITSLLIAVLQYGDQTRGALVVYPLDERDFTEPETATFKAFADLTTIGIAITQQLEQQRDIAIMAERNRLAREIHDTVAQSLTALVLQIDTIQNYLDRGDTAAVQDMLMAARSQARAALTDTRRAVQGLSAAALDTLSPAQVIASEAQQWETETGISAQFILTGDEQPLTPDQCTTLVRVAHEALTNARKHAKAKRVRIGIQYNAEDVTLLVEDDGVGFDTETRALPGPDGGYGLFGMNERVRLIGGSLQIDTTLGWGTRIRVVLPYRPSSPLSSRPTEDSQAHLQNQRKAEDSAALLEPPIAYSDTLLSPVSPALSVPQSTSAARIIPTPAAPSTASPSIRPGNGPAFQTESATQMLRVLIADDHALVRQGIRTMLETTGRMCVVGEAGNGARAAEMAAELKPDVVLMDLQMPEVDGLEGLRRIHAAQPALPVIILTSFQTDSTVGDALRVGARGFLLKDAAPSELIATIFAAHRGELRLSPAVTDRLAAIASGQAGHGGGVIDELNERELEVLRLLASGSRNKEIATKLFITAKTVEYHLAHIYSKLEVSNRTEAARIAIEKGIVAPETPA